MSEELNHIRRIETAQELKERLAKIKNFKNLEQEKTTIKKSIEGLKAKKTLETQKAEKESKELEKSKQQLREQIKEIEKNIIKNKNTLGERKIKILNARIKSLKERIKDRNSSINNLQKELTKIDKAIQTETFAVNKIQKSQEKLGIQTSDYIEISEFLGKGYYAVCIDRKQVKIVQVDKIEDFKDKHEIDLAKVFSYKVVDAKIADAWNAAIDLSAKTKVSPSELFALAEAKISIGDKFLKNEYSANAKAGVKMGSGKVEANANAKAGNKTTLNISDKVSLEHESTVEANAHLEGNILSGIKGTANLKAESKTTLNISDKVVAELDSFIEGYANVAVSAIGMLAEIGANSEIAIAVNFGKYISFSGKAYLNAKGGVYTSILGVMAAAEVETGAEFVSTARTPKKGEFQIEFAAKITPYGKAEAKAAIGLNAKDGKYSFLMGAKASVSAGVRANLGGTLKYGDENAATIEGELDFAFQYGVGVFEGVDFEVGNLVLEDNLKKRVFSMAVELHAVAKLGFSIKGKIALKLTEKHVKLLVDKTIVTLKNKIKHAIKEMASKEVYKQYKAIHQELEHYSKKVSDLNKQVKSNTYNALYKGIIKLQTTPKKAVDLSIQRHHGKLKEYKAQIQKLITALEAKGLKDLGKGNPSEEEKAKIAQSIQDIINKEVTAKDLNSLLSRRSRQDLGADLQKYADKYERRIKKFNEYINKDYIKYSQEIEQHYVKAVTIIEGFKLKLDKKDASAKDKKKARENINHEIDELNKLMDIFNTLVKTKEDLMSNAENLHGEDKELPGTDSTEVKKEINSYYTYLRGHMDSLMTKIDDLRDDLK